LPARRQRNAADFPFGDGHQHAHYHLDSLANFHTIRTTVAHAELYADKYTHQYPYPQLDAYGNDRTLGHAGCDAYPYIYTD
jgi:hypothetical protein